MRTLAVILLRVLALWMLADRLLPYLGSAVYGLTEIAVSPLPFVFSAVQTVIWLAFVLTLLFGAPGIARSITPASSGEFAGLSEKALTKVGFLLLGVFFVVTGVSGLTVDLPSLVQQAGSAAGNHHFVVDWNISWFVGGPALTKLVAGLFLWRWAARR